MAGVRDVPDLLAPHGDLLLATTRESKEQFPSHDPVVLSDLLQHHLVVTGPHEGKTSQAKASLTPLRAEHWVERTPKHGSLPKEVS